MGYPMTNDKLANDEGWSGIGRPRTALLNVVVSRLLPRPCRRVLVEPIIKPHTTHSSPGVRTQSMTEPCWCGCPYITSSPSYTTTTTTTCAYWAYGPRLRRIEIDVQQIQTHTHTRTHTPVIDLPTHLHSLHFIIFGATIMNYY